MRGCRGSVFGGGAVRNRSSTIAMFYEQLISDSKIQNSAIDEVEGSPKTRGTDWPTL